MKKLATIVFFVFAATLTAQAQKEKGPKGPQMTTEQQVILKVKKMTLALDLTAQQQKEITPLIQQQIETKTAHLNARKGSKKPTSDEIFTMENTRLDAQIRMRDKMKEILTKEQFEKFKKMSKEKKHKRMKRRKHQKVTKERRREKRD
ncbi:hypothetical protein [Polaribacter sp. HL-MS24]|uniref:hypothetical protein n=1 Tax=Polaribacter sp. HL-MS24 TaxID=3077735 RepID=UPI00293451A0|nr:hypothetical protein [Polaribacter sp. HL-MS24]WOC39312.1 hypothetical protein RRF69_06355 [Polaribacter sp. HL-MS24]